MPVNPAHVTQVSDADLLGLEGAIEPRHIHELAAGETSKALARFKRLLEQRLCGHQCMWMASFRGDYGRDFWQTELMDGWKVIDISTPLHGRLDYAVEKEIYFALAKEHGLDPQAEFTIRNAGKTRVHLIEDAISIEQWDDHWMSEVLQGQGSCDRMAGVFNLSEVSESVFILDRPPGGDRFTRADADAFYELLTEFPRLHYWLMLERGIVSPAQKPLSPKEREVLRELLGGRTETEIAEHLELTKGVLHNYVTALYRNYGVSSRYELVQLWLAGVETKGSPREL